MTISDIIEEFTELKTIYGLKDISDILYDVYINEDSDYYRVRKDNMRRSICNAYADFISKDINIINYTTAILMQDINNKFLLKIYDPENLSNGGLGRVPIVFTLSNSSVGLNYAVLNGQVTDNGGDNITEWGIYWSKTINPDTKQLSDTTPTGQPGIFMINMSNLDTNTNYYYKCYAKNKNGESYGNMYSFKTLSEVVDLPPVVTTTQSVNVTSHKMTLEGNVVSTGYDTNSTSGFTTIISRGFEYASGITEVFTNTSIYSPEYGGVGSFTCTLTGLTPSKGYTYRAFAINNNSDSLMDTGYGSTGYTITLSPTQPSVKITSYSTSTNKIDVTSQLISDDDERCTEVGICITTSSSILPTTGDTKEFLSSPPNNFIPIYTYKLTFSGLTSNTTYYVRAYIKNAYFVVYSNKETIKTNKA